MPPSPRSSVARLSGGIFAGRSIGRRSVTLPRTAKRPELDYVSHASVTNRLNEAAPGWTYDVEPVTVQGSDGLPHVVAVFGTMTVGGVTRQEVGAVDEPKTYGQELKEAISDFIRRGAMRFGVAIDLYAKEGLEGSTGTTATTAQNRDDSGDSSLPSPKPGPVEGTASSVEQHGSGGAVPTTSPGEGRVLAGTVPASGDSTSEGVASGDGRLGEGSDLAAPSDPNPIADAHDWAMAAKTLKTSKADCQLRVVEWFKITKAGPRQPSEIHRDELGFAVASLAVTARSQGGTT